MQQRVLQGILIVLNTCKKKKIENHSSKSPTQEMRERPVN